ncbi:hypothetical protein V6N11_031344 [Hibiscus sabdariffa]|uniref:DUF4283 domain-containing protein n=1 Tax=Hibiscus sabdariffa TaxID=183260 RepID=A0ABR2SY80_9ROSI
MVIAVVETLDRKIVVVVIRVLAKEIAATGLDGFKIMWVTGSMVLLAFPDVGSRERLLSEEVLSTWFGHVEEWSASAGYVSRRAWLSISGLPIHLWSEGSFQNIVGLWGRIDEVVEVASQGSVFPLVVQEAELREVVTQRWHANQLWGTESGGKGNGGSMVVSGVGVDSMQSAVSKTGHDSLVVKVTKECELLEESAPDIRVNGNSLSLTTVVGQVELMWRRLLQMFKVSSWLRATTEGAGDRGRRAGGGQ